MYIYVHKYICTCTHIYKHTFNECPRYETKQSDDEAPVIVEFWGMRSTLSLPSLPGPFWPGVVSPEKVLSMG